MCLTARNAEKKHEQNVKIVPFVPPIRLGLDSSNEKGIHFNSDSSKQVSLDNTWRALAMEVEKEGPTAGKIMGELVVIEHIEDINNVSISTLVLKNMTNLHAILGEVNSDCNDQCFNAYEILIMQLSRGNEVLTNSSDN